MAGPIVFISRNRIVDGRRAEFERAYAGAVGVIEATKPGTALFAAYVDRSVQAPRSGSSMSFRTPAPWHCISRARRNGPISMPALITQAGFEIYGQAPDTAIDQLRREAATVIDARVDVFAIPLGGFLRAPR